MLPSTYWFALNECFDVPFELLLTTDIQCEGVKICLKSYAIDTEIMQGVTAAWPHGNFTQVPTLHNMFVENPDAVVAGIWAIQQGVDGKTIGKINV